MPGNSSWMPYAPQRVKGFDDDDDDEEDDDDDDEEEDDDDDDDDDDIVQYSAQNAMMRLSSDVCYKQENPVARSTFAKAASLPQ